MTLADARAGSSIREAGDSALLLSMEPVIDPAVNARVLDIAAAIERRRIPGVRDVVPTFHSVAVYFDPLSTDVSAVADAMREESTSPTARQPGKSIAIPVEYGGDAGPDLSDVAAFAGCSPQAVIERHMAATYRVFMLGFLPGYPYMGQVDESIAAPRRSTPRVRVPAGSVGIAGRQTGIYPRESPGGWQIIGRTGVVLFDPDRTPPALLAPGDSVRFVPQRIEDRGADLVRSAQARLTRRAPQEEGSALAPQVHTRFVTILKPGLLTTIQDQGRWGYQRFGVPVSGAMDPVAFRLANALMRNALDAPTLEATVVGPEVRVEQDTRMTVTGADMDATADGAAVPMNAVVDCRAGTVIRLGARRSGARAYVAFDGGIDVPPVLGSRATHVLSGLGGMGGRALRAGDRIPLGSPADRETPVARTLSGSRGEPSKARPTTIGAGARLRVLPGPQADSFDSSALDELQRSRYTVASQSDRMGYRLTGGTRLFGRTAGDMISDAAFVGALQVPPSGDPILLMADRQTTGGYPQLVVVITADLPLAGQLAPGDWVEFEICTRLQAIEVLKQQEGQLRAWS